MKITPIMFIMGIKKKKNCIYYGCLCKCKNNENIVRLMKNV